MWAEIRREKIVFVFTVMLAIFLLGAGSECPARAAKGPALLLKEADGCRRSLLKSAKKRKYRHNWLKCISRYEKVYARYPKRGEAAWALYHSARLYSGLHAYSRRPKDLDDAVDLYRRLVDGYKTHSLADDAQYRIGEIYYRTKKDLPQAYVEFLKVDIRFPKGDMRPKARKMLDELAVTLGKSDTKKVAGGGKEALPGYVAVKDIRHWSTPNYTRVVLDMDGPVKYEHHLLKEDPANHKPRRLYVDLRKARVHSEIDNRIPIKDGLLQRARAGQYSQDTVRVVLDINSIGGYKVFHLHDPYRIVVDVRRKGDKDGKDDAGTKLKKRKARKGVRKSKKPDRTASLARQLGLNVKRIVIDPGHGGKDPGCVFRGGIMEKDIVLRIAKILTARIRAKIGCEVFLTRKSDVFVSLERRTAIANMQKADLFISLHINAHKNGRIRGVETYFLNMATDERAVMVAARENATSEKNISDLQAILNDLMLNTKIHESSRLAHKVQQGMIGGVKRAYKKVKSLGVKQAPFYVLIGAQMPAVLVETGFLTNTTERKRLISRKYHNSIAEGICSGISEYIKGIDQVSRLMEGARGM
jgi:N-acetylmuramoyl-L-alanine amidase